MRRLLIGFAALTLTACTPAERLLYDAWHQANPYEAEANAGRLTTEQKADGVEAIDPATFTAIVDHVHQLEALPACERYDRWIDAAGLPAHFHDVMRGESMCDPGAYNPSGATGLLQIMASWAGSCGTTAAGLFDPRTNINCAVHVYAVQGGQAWSTW